MMKGQKNGLHNSRWRSYIGGAIMRRLLLIVSLVVIGIISSCRYTANQDLTDKEHPRYVTLLIENTGLASLNIYDDVGKLAWVMGGESVCVRLRRPDTYQTLRIQIGHSGIYFESPMFYPTEGGAEGWTWRLNDRLLRYNSMLELKAIYNPCKL